MPSTVRTVNAVAATFLSFLLNGILLLLVRFKTPSLMRSYSNILVLHCISDVLFAGVLFVTAVQCAPLNGRFFFVLTGFWRPTDERTITLLVGVFFWLAVYVPIALVSVDFVSRYRVVCRNLEFNGRHLCLFVFLAYSSTLLLTVYTTPLLLKFDPKEAEGLRELDGYSFASMDVRGSLERSMLAGVTAAIWADYAFISFAVLRIRRVMANAESRQADVNRQVLSIMLIQSTIFRLLAPTSSLPALAAAPSDGPAASPPAVSWSAEVSGGPPWSEEADDEVLKAKDDPFRRLSPSFPTQFKPKAEGNHDESAAEGRTAAVYSANVLPFRFLQGERSSAANRFRLRQSTSSSNFESLPPLSPLSPPFFDFPPTERHRERKPLPANDSWQQQKEAPSRGLRGDEAEIFSSEFAQLFKTRSSTKRPSAGGSTSSRSGGSKSKSDSNSSASSQQRRLGAIGRAKSSFNEPNGIDAKPPAQPPASVQVVAAALGHAVGGKKAADSTGGRNADGTKRTNRKLRKSTSIGAQMTAGRPPQSKSSTSTTTTSGSAANTRRERPQSPNGAAGRWNGAAVFRPPLPPLPERRRRLRRPLRTPQITRSHSYTAATMSSALKRYDAVPISSAPRSLSPAFSRRQTPVSTTGGTASGKPKRRPLVRGNSTTSASGTPKKTVGIARRGSLQRKRPPKQVEAPPLPPEPEEEKEEEPPKVCRLNFAPREVVAPFATPPASAPKAETPPSPPAHVFIDKTEEKREARQSTATTEFVEDEEEAEKETNESLPSAFSTPPVVESNRTGADPAREHLLRALFGDDDDADVFDLDHAGIHANEHAVLMTLNRDGTLCSTMDEGAEVVQLNVGGTRFATTKATLISREPESFFAQLLQMDELGELPDPWRSAACRLDSGAYFIDRDGDLFAYVLDYLRNGKLLLPANFHEIARLREETLFYQLVGMNQQLLPYFSIRYPTKNAVSYTNGSAGVLSALETGGFITLGYRGTFAFGRDGQADVKFRKLHRILVCGKAQLCREVFGETLNESRDPDREGAERYTSRLYLKHQCLERACDNLAEKGFKLVTACSSGANGLGGSNALGVQGGGGQQVFNPAFRMVLAAPQQWKSALMNKPTSPLGVRRNNTTMNIWSPFGRGNDLQPPKDFMNQRNSGDLEESRWAHYTEYTFYREPQICPSISPVTTPRS